MNKKTKKAVLIAAGVLAGVPLTAFCWVAGARLFERFRDRSPQICETAKANAVRHMQNKYGIDAEAIDSTAERGGAGIDSWETGDYCVTVKAEGRTCQVYITGLEETDDGTDSFQAEEICSALTEEIRKTIPDAAVGRLLAGEDGGNLCSGDGLFREKYDGTNLQDILKAGGGNRGNCAEILCTAADLSADLPLFEWLQDTWLDCTVYSFDSEEHRALAEANLTADFRLFAPYITNYRRITANGNEQKTFEFSDCGDFLVCGYFDNFAAFASEIDAADFAQEMQKAGRNRKAVGKAYALSCPYEDMLIFYRLDRLPLPADQLYLEAMPAPEREHQHVMTYTPTVCGEYAAVRAEGGTERFVFTAKAKEGE